MIVIFIKKRTLRLEAFVAPEKSRGWRAILFLGRYDGGKFSGSVKFYCDYRFFSTGKKLWSLVFSSLF
jgi:hypothetical protein